MLQLALIVALQTSALEIAPCELDGLDRPAECGRLMVAEDRSDPQSRSIPISFVRVRAGTEDTPAEPFFHLTGGPGQEAVANAAAIAANAPLYQSHDVVIFDQRGIGRSNGLDCGRYDLAEDPDAFAEMFAQDLFDPEAYRACLQQLTARADLEAYTTTASAADIDELRAALGYDRINLSGGSYGTTLGLEYLRRHGDTVRSAVFAGVVPPSVLQTQTLAADLEAAIETTFRACESDAACAEAFPDFREDFAAMIAAVEAEPQPVELTNPGTGEPETVVLRPKALKTAIRYQLYGVTAVASLPAAAHAAAGGDYREIAQLLPLLLPGLRNAVYEGMWASIRCAEEAPFVDVAAAEADAEGTVFGPSRIRSLQGICEIWPRGAIPADFHEPVRSDVPVLLLAGAVDAATPPWMAEEAAAGLTNAELVVMTAASHWDLGGDCAVSISQAFVERLSLDADDVACAAQHARPDFEIPGEAETR